MKDARDKVMTSTQELNLPSMDTQMNFYYSSQIKAHFLMRPSPILYQQCSNTGEQTSLKLSTLHCLALRETQMLKEQGPKCSRCNYYSFPSLGSCHCPICVAHVLSERPSESFMHEEFALDPFLFEFLEGNYISLKMQFKNHHG